MYCLDPYWNLKINKIDYSDLKQSCKQCYSIRTVTDMQPKVDWDQLIYHAILNIFDQSGVTTFYGIRKFADEISKNINFENEHRGYSEQHLAPIYRQLFRVSSGRTNLYNLLDEYKKYDNIDEYMKAKNNIIKISNWWRNIILMIGKSAYHSDTNKDMKVIADYINKVADAEESTATQLLNLLK